MNVLFMCIVPKVDLYTSLADEFYRNGHQVTFVTSDEGETRFEDYKNHRIFYFHAGKMLNVSIPRKGINNLLFPSFCLKAVKHHINPKEYQLILMSTPPLGYFSSIKWIKKNNPSIRFYEILRDIHPEGTTHILKKLPGSYAYFKRQAQMLYDMANVVGCMSPYNVDLIRRNYKIENPEKIQLLPNWGRVEDFQEPSEEVKKRYGLENKFMIIYGGNMGKPQNLPLFLKLAKKKQHLQDVLFFFIGSGTERETLREMVKSEQIKNVRIENAIPHEDYKHVLRCASLGIITLSTTQFFANCPSKAVTYWQNKIPVLASLDHVTDFGTYFVDRGKCGLWSYADDYETLSANFDRLYYDSSFRKEMGENGHRFFLDNYTVDKAYNVIINSIK